MKVYLHGIQEQHNHRLFVQPGVEYPDVSDWHEADGRPRLIEINFSFGCADVPDNLGRYLIDKGLAQETMIITEVAQ